MAHFTAEQERKAACLICPHRSPIALKTRPCSRKDCSCSIKWLNNLRKSKKFRTDILAICHYLYDEDLHYFKIKD